MGRIVLIAQDFAPSQALERLNPSLVATGHSVSSFLASGKQAAWENTDILTALTDSQLLILGMSSSTELARHELLAVTEATARGISFGFYCDTFGGHHRPWFQPFRDKASFLFVINEREATDARNLFPHATVVATGNPMWEEFFTPKADRQAVRQRLNIADDRTVIICPGGKNAAINIIHWGSVIEAIKMIGGKIQNPIIIITLHPGDQTPASLYQDLVQFSPIPCLLLGKDAVTSSELIPAADLIVESISSIGIEAACQRKPIISFLSAVALERHRKLTGNPTWELCELGVSEPVLGDTALLSDHLLPSLGFSHGQRQRQAECFPAPAARGTAVNLMANAIQTFLAEADTR